MDKNEAAGGVVNEERDRLGSFSPCCPFSPYQRTRFIPSLKLIRINAKKSSRFQTSA